MGEGRKEAVLVPVQVPAFAALIITASVIGSFAFTYHVAPLLFVEDGSKASVGGFAGAVEVVRGGGFPAYITAAIPCFLGMIATEFLVGLCIKAPEAARYSLADAWSSVSAGVVQQMVNALVLKPMALATFPYSYIHDTLSVPYGLALPMDSPRTWLAALVLVDLGYYWLHRKCHEINMLWAGHSVHHSSDHFNFSTALRQSWFQGVAAPLFWLPMALLFPTPIYMAMYNANIVYQFWVHTCFVRRLGPLEWVLMTPSHHRVHHDRRVHKNFGGMLIVWDRLFGSFLDEEDATVHLRGNAKALGEGEGVQEEVELFGTIRNHTSWTEAVTQSMFWSPMVAALGGGKGVAGFVRAVWIGPGYTTAGAPRTLVVPSLTSKRIRFHSTLDNRGKAYVFVHFLLVVAIGFIALIAKDGPYSARLATGLFVLWTLYCQGSLLDCAQGAPAQELVRCIVTVCACAGALLSPPASLPTVINIVLAHPAIRGLVVAAAVAHALSAAIVPSSPKSFGKADKVLLVW
eukprot:CAMPEP_0206241954 /NCGR_PEP_ID=MMETSP0047_2-20121206/16791_1 /ASSEMBLY_ACC=CAM_ASM_000192 /TAXON_ID=195065 /ORGANISM="Chroomonas mesostigmatica_cf, Strain CCMP1168" /LENGTH=516 /DNA_ID=CAMNT_0053666925 /DNA_START=90 /DNA_END=1637 /DNA_ORIENTATION=+